MLGNNDLALEDYNEALRLAEPKDLFQVYEARAAVIILIILYKHSEIIHMNLYRV